MASSPCRATQSWVRKNWRARMPVRSSRRSPTPQPCSRLICDEIVDVEEEQRERVLVAQGPLDFLRQRQLEDRRGDQRGQRVADADRHFAAGDLLGVRAEDLERGAADRMGDERPRLRGGAEPLVERDFVEDDALGVMHRVEELPRRERRTVAGEVAHRRRLACRACRRRRWPRTGAASSSAQPGRSSGRRAVPRPAICETTSVDSASWRSRISALVRLRTSPAMEPGLVHQGLVILDRSARYTAQVYMRRRLMR